MTIVSYIPNNAYLVRANQGAAEQLATRLSALGQTQILVRKGKASSHAILLNRTGTGAAMGAKNLKAIACRGKRAYEYADPEAVKALAKKGGEGFKNSGFAKLLREMGVFKANK